MGSIPAALAETAPLFVVQTAQEVDPDYTLLQYQEAPDGSSDMLVLGKEDIDFHWRDTLRSSRSLKQGSSHVNFYNEDWILNSKWSLPRTSYKSIQALDSDKFLALTHDGEVQLLTWGEESGELLSKSLLAADTYGSHRIIDFVLPSRANGHAYFLLSGKEEAANEIKYHLTVGKASAASLKPPYPRLSDEIHFADGFIELSRENAPDFRIVSTYDPSRDVTDRKAFIPKTEKARVTIVKPERRASVIGLLYNPRVTGQNAEEWIHTGPAVLQNLNERAGFQNLESDVKANRSNQKKDAAFVRLIRKLSESGVFLPDLTLRDMIWNGEEWVLKRLPKSDLTVTESPQALRARYLRSLSLFTSNNVCLRALELTFRGRL